GCSSSLDEQAASTPGAMSAASRQGRQNGRGMSASSYGGRAAFNLTPVVQPSASWPIPGAPISIALRRGTAMKIAKVSSVCECQGRLCAELDEGRKVLRGWVLDSRGRTLRAPCTGMHITSPRFDLGWLCPLCGRNTLRSFDASGLV